MRSLMPVLLVLGTACPGGGSRQERLTGWWLIEGDDASGDRAIAFAQAEDALWQLGVDPGEPVSDLYAFSLTGERMLTSVEVDGRELVQTVVSTDGFTPVGTEFRSTITSLERNERLVLETEAVGEVAYDYYPTCPLVSGADHLSYTAACFSYFATGASLAVDDEGHVHSLVGYANLQPGGCTPVPVYSLLSDGCEAVSITFPNVSHSAIAVDGDTVWTAFAPANTGAPDYTAGSIVLREGVKRSTDFVETILVPDPANISRLAMTLTGEGPALAWSWTDRTLLLARQQGSEWQIGEPTDSAGQPLRGFVNGLSHHQDGRLVLLLSGDVDGVAVEQDGGEFAFARLPDGMRTIGEGVHVDGDDRIHVQLTGDDGDHYAIGDETSWTQLPLNSAGLLLGAEDAPWSVLRYVGQDLDAKLVLTTLEADGTSHSVSLQDGSDGGANPFFGEAFGHWAGAVGSDGTIAATFSGPGVYTRRPQTRVTDQTTAVTVQFNQPDVGRVVSTDGRIDCRDTCTVDIPRGTVLEFIGEPDDGYAGGPQVIPTGEANEVVVFGRELQITAFFAAMR